MGMAIKRKAGRPPGRMFPVAMQLNVSEEWLELIDWAAGSPGQRSAWIRDTCHQEARRLARKARKAGAASDSP